jgi:hypothetical protein
MNAPIRRRTRPTISRAGSGAALGDLGTFLSPGDAWALSVGVVDKGPYILSVCCTVFVSAVPYSWGGASNDLSLSLNSVTARKSAQEKGAKGFLTAKLVTNSSQRKSL